MTGPGSRLPRVRRAGAEGHRSPGDLGRVLSSSDVDASSHAVPAALERAEQIHTERLLVLGRAMLVIVSQLALRSAGAEPDRYAPIVATLTLLFGGVSAGLLLVGWKTPLMLKAWAVPLHVHDLLWATLVTTFTRGPATIFFAFFLYVLVAAAYRWGLAATVWTAVAANVLLLAQGLALSRGLVPQAPPVDWGGLIVSGPLLVGLGLFIGYLADEQRRLRREADVTRALVGSARIESGVRGSLAAGAGEILPALGASRLWAVLTEAAEARTILCDARLQDGRVELATFPISEAEAASWRFGPPLPCDAFLVRRGPRDHGVHRWTIWPGNTAHVGGTVPPVLTDTPWEAVLGARIAQDDWSGQVVVLDPARAHRRIGRAEFLYNALRQAVPAFQGVTLMQRLRTRIGAIERARVARELHDGVIQSLSGLDMQVEAARRQLASAPELVPASLARVQAVLRDEALNVRDLMHQLRHTNVDPRRVVESMTELVERFRRDTGIAVTFASDLSDPELPRDTARELVRMLQELLVNIRKHSGARSVVVRFGLAGDAWCLVVDDDGRGFDFEGQYTLAQLDDARRGPVVLKERVRAVGGRLWITSQANRGARVEIHVPRGKHVG
jgi:signal transduction histidine kinase